MNSKPPLRWRGLPRTNSLTGRTPYWWEICKYCNRYEAIHQLVVTMAAYIAGNDNDMMKFLQDRYPRAVHQDDAFQLSAEEWAECLTTCSHLHRWV